MFGNKMIHLPSETFERQFYTQLDGPPSRRGTLERLKKLGCDTDFLLMWVELSCGLNIRQEKGKPARGIKGFVTDKRSLAARVKQAAKRLLKDAADIEKLNSILEITPEFRWPPSASIDLSNRIRSYASGLNGASQELNNRWSRALRTEPGNAVRVLVEYVKSMTGGNRYDDVADLLEVGHLAYGRAKAVTAVEVRKMATRARTRQKSSE